MASPEPVAGYHADMKIDIHEWVWTHKYLDRPRRDRWVAIEDAKAQGLVFDPETLLDALGLDAEAFADLFANLPQEERRAAARAESKRRGLGFSTSAINEAFSGRRW